jgi:hypothetical protein
MSLRNRPFVGNWQLSSQSVVQHTPDAIVFVNGYQELATCPACSQAINIQKYITSVSADASTESSASANFSVNIPQHEMSRFTRDGNYLLQPSLEVVIIMRGYFPMKGFADLGQDPNGFDPSETPVYPYYQVFRGVVTEVSHEFSGGFYSATVQCSNLLHFWQNQKLSTNGAVMGPKPDESMVEPDLRGHKFTGANPYSIMYTLVKSGFGAAFGVDFVLSQNTNIKALDDDGQKSMFKHAAEWWEKRWSEHSGSLRMYGIDGRVFNAFEQAYLGSWYDTREKGSQSALFKTAQRIYQDGKKDFNMNRYKELLEASRELGYDPMATRAGVYDKTGSGQKFATEDVLRMQAFSLDLGRIGSINLFETEYMSKMEIAEAVKAITGFEFYQDVDGDLVFKPPMYNLDTREDPVYRIADRDLISYSESESEPEATMCKGTGSHFSNVSGTGLDGWLGVGGVFIDYRLVAKYGYREETFETNYMSSRQAIFVSAINRLDLANVGVKSGSITIPIRPELRPGYPVYVECLDCFFYAQSLSHSFSPGGQCTTTINGVAKRSKWFPPMEPTGDGDLPGIAQVRLDAPGEFPEQPMYGYDHLMSGAGGGDSGPPRSYGFPNVVMAMDPHKTNLSTVDLATGTITAEGYIQIALQSGILERGPDSQTFLLRSGNEEAETILASVFQAEYENASAALAEGTYTPEPSTNLGRVISALWERSNFTGIPEESSLRNYLSLQTSLKAMFSPGTSAQGRYRYFSCSHPDPQHQAPGNLYVDQEAGEYSVLASSAPDSGYTTQTRPLKDAGGGKGIALDSSRPISRGIKVAAFSQKEQPEHYDFPTEVVSTADIRFVTFGPQIVRKGLTVSSVASGASRGTNFKLPSPATKDAFADLLATRAVPDPEETISARLDDEYFRLMGEITQFALDLGAAGNTAYLEESAKASSVKSALNNFSQLATNAGDYKISEVFLSKADPGAINQVTTFLGAALWSVVSAVVRAGQKSIAVGDSYEEVMTSRAKFIEGYTNQSIDVPDSAPGKAILQTSRYEEVADYTPIFPVSDAGGYEVYGNLPYGRGVTVEKYAQLMGSATQGTDTSDPTEASESSVTWSGGVGSNMADLQAVEKFIILFLAGEDPQTILGEFSDRQKRAVLAAANTTEASGITRGSIETLKGNSTSQAAKIRNSPVTSFARGQAYSSEVAARNLAEISLGGEICACKGADASFLIQAYSAEYVDLYPDPVQGWQENLAGSQHQAWQESRDAMSGQVRTPQTATYAEQFQKQGDAVRSLTGSSRNQAGQQVAQGQEAFDTLLNGEDS